jgi:uncharacterized protein (TIGR02186 family)
MTAFSGTVQTQARPAAVTAHGIGARSRLRRVAAHMRRLALHALTASLIAACGTIPAHAERLVLALSNHQVLINSSFTGVELVLFGTVEHDPDALARGAYDLVATVTGPREEMVTRRKERMLGIWVNVEARTFAQAPAYMAVLSNRPLAAIAGTETLRRLNLGLANAPLPSEDPGAPWADPFRTAFIDINHRLGLYREQADAVKFLTADLFRATIALPANAPIGTYDVDVDLFADGLVLATQSAALNIQKVGFEQFVATAAREHGVLYGIATVTLAMLTGWFGAVVFRRD